MLEYLSSYISSKSVILMLVQVVIILVILWIFYKRFIKGTVSANLIHGLFGLIVMWMVSWLLLALNLEVIGLALRFLAAFLSIALVVIFQPELRKFLGLMGEIKFIRAMFSPKLFKEASAQDKISRAASEITKAVEYMSRKNTGALMVFEDSPYSSADKKGVAIDAVISSELILTIFFNKTPLHDGAMIIGQNRIISAGAILPLTEKKDLAWKYGTRHRAAIGMSENAPVYVLVVSEETGDVSLAYGGKIKKYEDMKKLQDKIESILTPKR